MYHFGGDVLVGDDLSNLIERIRTQGQSKLPPERQLAEDLGISRGTLRKELARLSAKGQIVQRTGRGGGSFVQKVDVDSYLETNEASRSRSMTVWRSLNSVLGVPTLLTDQGYEPSTRILRAEERAALPSDRELLQLHDYEKVVMIRRLRSANGVPLSLEEMILPAAIFPDILKKELDSIYVLMREKYQTSVARAEEEIGIGQASATAAYLLGVSLGSPLFDIERTAYDENERPIEVSRDLFRSDITRLSVTSR